MARSRHAQTPTAPTPAPSAGSPSPSRKPRAAAGSPSIQTPPPSIPAAASGAPATSTAAAPALVRATDGKFIRNPEGRASILEVAPERAQLVIDALARGHYIQHAADLAGISRQTVTKWMERGQTDAEQGTESHYQRFFVAAQTATAKWTDERVQAIQRAEEKDWKASAALLGRRHRGLWSEQTSQGGESGHAPMQINIGIALPGVANTSQVIDAQVVSVPMLDDE